MSRLCFARSSTDSSDLVGCGGVNVGVTGIIQCFGEPLEVLENAAGLPSP